MLTVKKAQGQAIACKKKRSACASLGNCIKGRLSARRFSVEHILAFIEIKIDCHLVFLFFHQDLAESIRSELIVTNVAKKKPN